MTRRKAFVARHPVATYFVLTFVISWGGALLAIGGSGGMRGTTPDSDPRFAYALIAMLAGPSATGILLTALVYGRAGLREVRSRLLTWRVGATWYAIALLTAPVLMTGTLLALSSSSPAFLPGLFTSDDRGALLRISLAVGLTAGLFEELGWTGFAIPALRRRRGVFATGVIVGIVWSAWHLLPNVWARQAAAGDLAVSVYLAAIAVGVIVGYLTAFRVLMVWVYDRTQSLFVAMLIHVSLTASLLMLNPLGISGAQLLTYSFALSGALWLVIGVIAARSGWHLEHGRFETRPGLHDAGPAADGRPRSIGAPVSVSSRSASRPKRYTCWQKMPALNRRSIAALDPSNEGSLSPGARPRWWRRQSSSSASLPRRHASPRRPPRQAHR